MREDAKLIVMLTHNDKTVENAWETFDASKDTRAEYWGFKEEPLSLEEMKRLYAHMHDCGKKTVLEVVAYTEAEGLKGAQLAVDCGCDILMGTIFSPAILAFCKGHQLKYMPFVGTVVDRPSILKGSIDGMIREAKGYLALGVYGFDLLGYRYEEDAGELIRRFVAEVPAPVCVAGSVNSYQRLDELKQAAPWAFTIGGAFFEEKFGQSFARQVDKVCAYMRK